MPQVHNYRKRNCLGLPLALLIAAVITVQATAPVHAQATAQEPHTIDELLFFPAKHPDGNWTPENLNYQEIDFAAEDQTRLHGWYCPTENPRATVLIAHGNAGNIAFRSEWLRYLQTRAKVSVFMFDYRGYGRSEGKPTIEGVLRDARAARGKLRELAEVSDAEMILMGESLGGAVAVQLATESAPRGLILQSTFASLRDVANAQVPNLAWLVPPSKLNSAKLIANYRGPLLQSHGDRDEVIPFNSGRRLFTAANQPKTFVKVAGAKHNTWMTDQYLQALDQFIDQLGK